LNIPKVHTVCIAGAAADIAARITALLDEQRTRLDARWKTADAAGADLLLIDADSVYGHMDWLRAVGNGRLVAALTATPEAYDADHCLRMPVASGELVDLLNRMGNQLDERVEGAPSKPAAAAAAAPASLPRAAGEPTAPAGRNTAEQPIVRVRGREEAPIARAPRVSAEHSVVTPRTTAEQPVLAASLRVTAEQPVVAPRAAAVQPVVAPRVTAEQPAVAPRITAEQPVAAPRTMRLLDLLGDEPPLAGRLRLEAEGLPTLFIDTHERNWYSTAGLKALAPWCNRTLAATEVHVVGESEFRTATAALSAHPHARLVWLVHLTRGEGQLASGLDPNGRYKLARWPQSERDFPKHFRIATMMLKEAATLEEIADLSGGSIADIANFINAYNALGYIESAEQARPAEESRRSGLFGRVKKTSAAS
jgi:hypothetical protein